MLSLIFAATAAFSPTCADLSSKYDELEYGWAATHTLSVGLLKADEVFLQSLQSLGERGSQPLYNAQRGVADSRRSLKDEDAQYALRADRIITLMGANKCKAPDHVASWFTYSQENPNKKIYVSR